MSILALMIWIWCGSALLTVALHVGISLLIDGRVDLGTWGKLALSGMGLLGPLGLCLEVVLLAFVFRDMCRENQQAQADNSRRRLHEDYAWSPSIS